MCFTRPWAKALILCISLGLSACGGGAGGSSTPNNANTGGGGSGTTPPPGTGEPTTPPPSTPTTGLSFSPSTLTFSAASPTAALPAEQTITATYNGTVSGKVRIVALSDGIPAPQPIESMTRFNGDNTPGVAIVRPISPDMLGPGTHTETVTVRACVDGGTVCATNQLPGSPQTFTVTYVIGPKPVPPAVVMPRLAVAGTPGRVIVRGSALGGTTTVHFGPHAATNVSVVSDTEVHASYPALASGTYAVALNAGAIPFNGSILAMPPTNYSDDSIDLPAGSWGLTFLHYDAERGALLVGAYDAGPGTASRLWRFTHDGADWNVTNTVEMDGVLDAVVSPDGARILATAYAGVVELSAQDLTVLRTTPRPTEPPIPVFGSIAIANNGFALIGGGDRGQYYFSLTDRTLTRSGGSSGPSLATMDGSRMLGSGQGDPGHDMFHYDASSMLRNYRLPRSYRSLSMATRHGETIVVSPEGGFPSDFVVYSAQSDTPLGVLPGAPTILEGSLSIRLAEVNPQGTRAYALREDNTLHTFALDRPTVGGAFPEIGTPSTLVLPTLNSQYLFTTMTPDGRTLFIGGNRGVLVIPTLD